MPGEGSLGVVNPAEQPERQTMNFRLSSITAPKRVYSISSDDDEDDNDEEGDWNQSDDEADERAEAQDAEADQTQSISHAPLRNSNVASHLGSKQDSTDSLPASAPLRNAGVTLDFRKPTTPGMTPRTPFDQRHLMEVDELIVDESLVEHWPAPDQNDVHGASASAVQITRFADQETPVRLHRPRSIPRRKAPVVQDSDDTRPEYTAVNTRRNSVRVVEKSIFFNAAPDG